MCQKTHAAIILKMAGSVNVFDLMRIGQQRLQAKKSAHQFECEDCGKSFVNMGALKTHQKFKHNSGAKPDVKLHLKQSVGQVSKRRKRKKESKKASPEKFPRNVGEKNVKQTRHRYSNLKKYKFILQFELLKEEYSMTFKDEWEVRPKTKVYTCLNKIFGVL